MRGEEEDAQKEDEEEVEEAVVVVLEQGQEYWKMTDGCVCGNRLETVPRPSSEIMLA